MTVGAISGERNPPDANEVRNRSRISGWPGRPRAFLLGLLLALVPLHGFAAEAADAEATDEAAAQAGANDETEAPRPGEDDPAPADAESADGGPAPPGGDKTADAAKGPAADEPPGVFIPTEEISEDFAVSFPVDI